MAKFNRASTAVKSDGTTVAAGVPRFDSMTGIPNLITNGDFSSGLTGWTHGSGANVFTSNGEGICTATTLYGGLAYPYAGSLSALKGHKLYASCWFKSDSTNNFMCFINDGVQQQVVRPTGDNTYQYLSAIQIVSTVATNMYCKTQDGRTSGWTECRIKNLIMIDLTRVYGYGNEPTKAQCDVLFADWYKFGLKIEEGITNYANLANALTYSGGNLGTTLAPYYSIIGNRITASGQPLNNQIPGWKVPITQNTAVTIRGYTNATSIGIYWQGYDSSNNLVFSQISATASLNNGYFYKQITTGVYPTLTYINIGIGCIGLSEYYMEFVQMELKPYVTSFISGFRAVESLTVPTNALNLSACTFEFDCSILKSPTNNNGILYMGAYWTNNSFVFGTYTASGKFVLYIKGSTNSGWSSTMVSHDAPLVGEVYRIAITILNADTFAWYINGVLQYAVTITDAFTMLPPCIFGSSMSWNPNFMISNIRVSNIIRTGAELANIGTLAVDEYTTYYLPLNSDLGAQTAPRVLAMQDKNATVQARVCKGYRAMVMQNKPAVAIQRKISAHKVVEVPADAGRVSLYRGKYDSNRTTVVKTTDVVEIIEPTIDVEASIMERVGCAAEIFERLGKAEVIGVPLVGDTIKIRGTFTAWGGALADPSSITLTFYNISGQQIGDIVVIGSQHRISAGVYEYDYIVPAGYGPIRFVFACMQGNYPQLIEGQILRKNI